MTDPLRALTRAGVSIWLDDLSRARLTSGSLADPATCDHVVGVTKNPSIFAKARTGSDSYSAQITDLSGRGVAVSEALRALSTFDVRWACDVRRPVCDVTGGTEGRVSIGVDPRLTHDTGARIAVPGALWCAVDRPNLFVKIPAAREGLLAIAACLAEAININVTLIFSLSRYDGVMDAFLDGTEKARNAGRDLSSVGSLASFFVPRVDTKIDSVLGKAGNSEAVSLRGRAAIANARLAYPHYDGCSPRRAGKFWRQPEPDRSRHFGHRRRSRTRPTLTTATWSNWSLPGEVNSMPESTFRPVADHRDVPADSMRPHHAGAQQVLDRMRAHGIDHDGVVRALEDDGLAKFAASWDQLGGRLAFTLWNQAAGQ
jgi:transaldolase